VVSQTIFQWYIYSAVFIPKINGIGQLLLKLSFVVGWYPFLRHSVVVHYWADLQSVHGFHCDDNVAPTWNVSEC